VGTIEDVKAQLDIVETVRGYVPALKRVGRSWKAPCPFHSEKTPSFIVDPERGTWHCFGACSTGGDVIGFVQRIEHLEFRDALQRCAERAGVELRPPSARERQEREVHERLLRANEAAAVYFQAALAGPQGAAALAYAEQRGLDQAARDTWQIGYAPDEWRGLTEHLMARGFTEADLREAGLGIDGDRGMYDRFRDRLMYPTRDARGRMIGFGARALSSGQEPKYLNTPQTPLFDKSGSLYGLDRAGEEARRADRMVVVEGYMDVIACHQAGIRNVVASMGTSITEKQMTLVQRYTQNVRLMLDGDAAGSAATLRGIGVVASAAGQEAAVATLDWRGLVSYQYQSKTDIRVVVLPAGEDPDSLVRSDPDRLRALLESAKPVADHLFAAVEADMDATNPQSRSRAVETLAPTVAGIADPVVRAHYVQRLARLGQVEERTVLALLSRGARPSPVPSQAEVARTAKVAATAPDGEAQLLHLLLLRDEARDAGLDLDGDVFEDSANRRLFEAWCAFDDLDAHLLDLDDDVAERVSALHASAVGAWDPAALEAKHVAPRVGEIARLLRLRRARARFLPAAVAQATAVAEARRGAAPAAEIEELETDLAAMDAQQRTLVRRARGETTSYSDETVSASPRGGGNGVEGSNDADV
jgi:DNA primase